MGGRAPGELLDMAAPGFIPLPTNRIDKWQAFVFLDSLGRLASLLPSDKAMPHCIAEGPLAFLDI